MGKIKAFYSYSHIDEEYRVRLETSLAMLKRYDDLEDWHFRKIDAGEEWDHIIKSELDQAEIIMLLVSPDFLASDYCYDIEVKKAIEKHENGTATVIPIILRECDWNHEKSPLVKLQGVPENGLPISQWLDRDSAFHDVTTKLKKIIKKKVMKK